MATSNTQPTKTTAASTKATDYTVMTFNILDGKQHTGRDLMEACDAIEKQGQSITEDMLKVAKALGSYSAFDTWDKDVRKACKRGKAPAKASAREKAQWGETPKAWRNAVSIIKQSFTRKLDVIHAKNVYGKGGLNEKLKAAQKGTSGTGTSSTDVPDSATKELQPIVLLNAFATVELRLQALNQKIAEQPDNATAAKHFADKLNRFMDTLDAELEQYINSDKVAQKEADKAKSGVQGSAPQKAATA